MLAQQVAKKVQKVMEEKTSDISVEYKNLHKMTSNQEIPLSDVFDAILVAFAPMLQQLLLADPPVRSGKQEMMRTYRSLCGYSTMMRGSYDDFVAGQIKAAKLSPDSFKEAKDYFFGDKPSVEDFASVMYMIATNDVGKRTPAAHRFAEEQGIDLDKTDHDLLLWEMASKRKLVGLDDFSQERRDDIICLLEVGGQLNVPAWLQGEAPACTLRAVINVLGKLPPKRRERIVKLKWAEIYFDVAGAGYEKCSGNWMLQPMSKAFMEAFIILTAVLAEGKGVLEAYLAPFAERAGTLNGILECKQFDMSNPESVALLRMLSMARIVSLGGLSKDQTREEVLLFIAAFEGLQPAVHNRLVTRLNVSGLNETAVFPSMAPEMFVQALANLRRHGAAKNLNPYQKSMMWKRALQSLMRVLNRALIGSGTSKDGKEDVLFHDLSCVAKRAKSPELPKTPDCIEKTAKRQSAYWAIEEPPESLFPSEWFSGFDWL